MNVLAQPVVKARLDEMGVTTAPNTANQFGAFIRSEHEQWAKVARLAGVKPE